MIFAARASIWLLVSQTLLVLYLLALLDIRDIFKLETVIVHLSLLFSEEFPRLNRLYFCKA